AGGGRLGRPTVGGGRGAGPGWRRSAAASACWAGLATRTPGPAGPQGDEPHYLVMAHSLWIDGDLDLADEFERQEYAAFFPGRLSPHPSPANPPGHLYSLHSPGLPLLILPGYALGGLRGAQLVLCGVAALAGALVHRATRAAAGDKAAAVAWAVFAFTPPVPVYAVSIYPEVVAALATAIFVLVAGGRPGWGGALAAAFAAGAVPWLHSKFLPLGALGLLLVLLRPCAWRVRAAAGAVFTALVGGLLVYFRATYGVASFSAAFGPPDLDLRRLPWGTGALLLDRQFGLVPFSPVWLLAFPGLVWLLRRILSPAIDLDPFLPSFFERDVATVVLALTLLAAVAVAWRWRGRGVVLGAIAYAAVAGAMRAAPLVDPRLATEDVIDRWDPDNWAGPFGPPPLREEGRAVLDEARIVPEALVPRRRRGEFPYPMFAREDRYRVGGPTVRATAVDRSVPEADGFRLAGGEGVFLVDGPAPAAVRVEVRREAPADSEEVS